MSELVLCIIPARSGSKGIPGKNTKLLQDKPLLAYTAETAISSNIFDRIILSTDSDDIAELGRKIGLEVPFIRPADLATDESPMLPVMQHCVQHCIDESWIPSIICLLQPTAPFRKMENLIGGLNLIKTTNCDSVVSVEPVPGHYLPHVVMRINAEGKLSHFLPDGERVKRRQDAEPAYTRNGSFYYTRTRTLMDMGSIYGKECLPFVETVVKSVNLDTKEDWDRAEKLSNTYVE